MEIFGVAGFLFFTVSSVAFGSPTGLDKCSQCQNMVASLNLMLSEKTRAKILPALCEAFAGFLFFTISSVAFGSPTGLDKCSQCQNMVASLNLMLSEKTRAKILPALCEAFAVESAEMCSELGQLAPSQLCQSIGQCDQRGLVYEPESRSGTEMEIIENRLGNLPCAMCENIMKIAHAFLSSKEHQKFLLNILKSVCRFVPFVTRECLQLVDTYGSLVIELAEHYLNPETCKLFHICPAGQETAAFGDECKLCKFGVGVIYDTVGDPTLETRIEQFTQELCTEYVGDDEECVSLATDLTEFLVPLAEELRKSDFFRNACERANICSEDEVTFY